jgi:hypothetical protein
MLSILIEYVSLGFGNKAKSKEMKAKPVLRLLGDERLLFSNSCQGLTDIYTELEKFGTKADAKDDIVSALSLLVDQYASYADADAIHNISSVDYVADRKSQAIYDMVHGLSIVKEVGSQDDNPVEEVNKSKSTFVIDVDPLEGLFN